MPQFFRAAFVLIGLALSALPVRAADVAIDRAVLSNDGKGKITFKNIILKDCNLSQAEATSLFTGALSREEAGAMLGRMAASQVNIPEAEIEAESGDRFTVRDIVAEGIEHGEAKSLSVASADGVLPDDSGDATLHAGALRIERISMPGLGAALRTDDPGLAAFRFSRLSWEGGQFSTVDKQTPAGAPGGNRIQLHAGAATMVQNFDADGAPLDSSASFTGFSLKLPPQSKAGAALAAFGYSELNGDLQAAGVYDPAAKTYLLKNYAIDMKNIGRVALSAHFSGLNKTVFSGEKAAREQAGLDAFVDWAQIDVSNAGMFDKIVAYVSLSQGKTPDTVKTEWRAIIAQAPLLFEGAQAIAVAAQAIDKFIADPKTLTLRVKGKDSALKFGDIVHMEDPAAFLNRLEVTSPPGPSGPVKAAPGTRL